MIARLTGIDNDPCAIIEVVGRIKDSNRKYRTWIYTMVLPGVSVTMRNYC